LKVGMIDLFLVSLLPRVCLTFWVGE